MEWRKTVVLAALGAFVVAGCAGNNAFHPVDLDAALSPETLRRYQEEAASIAAARGVAPGKEMAWLEYRNWWPLGLLAYYRRDTVMLMPSPSGPRYEVESGRGYGPLALLLATSRSATYDAQGRRLGGMKSWNALLGHLLMIHSGDALLSGGHRQETASMHLLHHLFSIHRMDGHTYVSLFTYPNPIGGTWPGHCRHATPADH